MDAERAGNGSGFPSTHWTQVYAASDYAQEAGSRALAELLRVYRPALQRHLRYRFSGVATEELEDWISGFIKKKILEQDLLRKARKGQGKFRNFVLKALDRFAEDQRRSQARRKRQPEGGLVPAEEALDQPAQPSDSKPDPGDLAWATQVIEQARSRTEAFYQQKGAEVSWAVFMEACYLPLYRGEDRPADAELARRYGFESAREVSNKLVNVKRRFGCFLREIVREYVPSEKAVDAEIRELIAIVSAVG